MHGSVGLFSALEDGRVADGEDVAGHQVQRSVRRRAAARTARRRAGRPPAPPAPSGCRRRPGRRGSDPLRAAGAGPSSTSSVRSTANAGTSTEPPRATVRLTASASTRRVVGARVPPVAVRGLDDDGVGRAAGQRGAAAADGAARPRSPLNSDAGAAVGLEQGGGGAEDVARRPQGRPPTPSEQRDALVVPDRVEAAAACARRRRSSYSGRAGRAWRSRPRSRTRRPPPAGGRCRAARSRPAPRSRACRAPAAEALPRPAAAGSRSGRGGRG